MNLYEVDVVGGYYGEEIDGVYFTKEPEIISMIKIIGLMIQYVLGLILFAILEILIRKKIIDIHGLEYVFLHIIIGMLTGKIYQYQKIMIQ